MNCLLCGLIIIREQISCRIEQRPWGGTSIPAYDVGRIRLTVVYHIPFDSVLSLEHLRVTHAMAPNSTYVYLHE
jgi:hypothetical protein